MLRWEAFHYAARVHTLLFWISKTDLSLLLKEAVTGLPWSYPVQSNPHMPPTLLITVTPWAQSKAISLCCKTKWLVQFSTSIVIAEGVSTYCLRSAPPSTVPGTVLEVPPYRARLLDSGFCSYSRSILRPFPGQYHCVNIKISFCFDRACVPLYGAEEQNLRSSVRASCSVSAFSLGRKRVCPYIIFFIITECFAMLPLSSGVCLISV